MKRQRSRPDNGMLSELRMLGEGLPIGTTTNGEICPRCGGGRTAERSLSVTRMDALRLAYCCHRATCGLRGFIGGTFSSSTSVSVPSDRGTKTTELYSAETQGLGEDWLYELGGLYRFSEDEIRRLGWTEEVNSCWLVVRIRQPDGKERGVHTRSRKWDGQSSATRDYRGESAPWMGWFFRHDGGRTEEGEKSPIVLVEDVLSAAKVATSGFRAASLMGCNLSLDQFLEAQEAAKGNPIVLALDRDATDKALNHVHRYGFLSGGNLIPLLLSKDLKYHTKEEIVQMVDDVIGHT